jgi:hypothetical protein
MHSRAPLIGTTGYSQSPFLIKKEFPGRGQRGKEGIP